MEFYNQRPGAWHLAIVKAIARSCSGMLRKTHFNGSYRSGNRD
jgi:hypothetical protein